MAIHSATSGRPFTNIPSLKLFGPDFIQFLDSRRLITLESKEMARKTTVLVLALIAVLVLQFADCMSAKTQDQQSMQCCGSMPCDPSNQTHDCCKGMVSSQSPSVLPIARVTLDAPVMVVADTLPSLLVLPLAEAAHPDLDAPQHSPPELYALHSSFLI